MEVPFDRVEVRIKGYNGEQVIAYNQMWTKTELIELHPQYLSQSVAARVAEMTQAMAVKAKEGKGGE
jgi:hypothetical protein